VRAEATTFVYVRTPAATKPGSRHYIDSLGVVSLMDFIETSVGIELREGDLFDERFATIDGMSGVIADRLSSQTPRADAL
jgi:acyl carrier protein